MDEALERTRIKREREQLNLSLTEQRQTCYQKLAVTPCLNEARDQHNEKMRDLKRQEVKLNDARRKRAAAERVRAMDERNSPQAQLQRAENQGRALEAAKRREASQVQRHKDREAQKASAARSAQAASSLAPDRTLSSPKPQGKPRLAATAKVAPKQHPGQAAKTQTSRQQTLEREQQAAERRAKAAEREAKRKKPAAAGLPVPK